jgi:predicted phage baseplate assembly protein
MPLPTPILDDRSYLQLRDELVRRIPVYAPEWSDHNASDPGITLIELFAFLGENLLYRFNQIPEATKLAFLRLLQIPMGPAVAARTMVAMTTTRATGALVPVGASALAGKIAFETATGLRAWPLRVIAAARLRADPPQTQESVDFTAAALDARGGLKADEVDVYYRTSTLDEDPSKAGAAPIDFANAVDGALWIAVLRTNDTDVTALGGAQLTLGILPDEVTEVGDELSPCPGESESAQTTRVMWHASSGDIDATTGQPVYLVLAVERDETEGMTRPGVVQLRLPNDSTEIGAFLPDDPDLAGTGTFPPELERAEDAAKVLFWLRVTRADRPLGRIRWVGINATRVAQQQRALTEFLGIGTGQPNQVGQLANTPVIAASLLLEVEENGRWSAWKSVDTFAASDEDARHYVLDLEAGTVRFGNGVRGRVPQIGERIRATEYRHGGGPAGNVAAKAITKLEPPPDAAERLDAEELAAISELKLTNPFAGRGGAPAESIADAIDRVPGELRRRDRAVTRDDFQEFALQTPGAAVGRAECLPRFHPLVPDEVAAGVVTVVVWPREDRMHPNAPLPERALLRDVCCWLDARRLVTTEVWVIPPTYRKIAVAVGVHVKPAYAVEAVRHWVEVVLRQYLAPLPPYGPEGRGWPLGRRVHGPELEAAVLQVEGVEYIEDDLRVAEWSEGAWRERTVVLRAWEVPELHEISVVDGPPLPVGQPVGVPQPVVAPAPGSAPGSGPGSPSGPSDGQAGEGPAPEPPRPGRTTGVPPTPGGRPGEPARVRVPVPIPVIREEC